MTTHRSLFLKNHDDATKREMVELFPAEKRARAIAPHFPGITLNNSYSVKEALQIASADFTVGKRPLMAVLSGTMAIEVPGKVALCRLDTGAPLGVATPSYGVVQIADALAPAIVLVERGEMELTSIQVKDSGAMVRLTGLIGLSALHMPDSDAADVLAHFATFEAHFNGATCNRARLHTLRLICLNGATALDSSGLVSIRHTTNAEDRTRQAFATLFNLTEAAQREAASFQELAEAPMNAQMYRAFAERLLAEVRGEADTVEKTVRRERDIAELEELFLRGAGNSGSTLWDGYNSVTDWLDHQHARRGSSKSAEAVFESNSYGSGDKMKARARALLSRF